MTYSSIFVKILISFSTLISTIKAQQCSETCVNCSPAAGCQTCITGYRAVQGTCQQIGIPFCIELNAENACIKCRDGYRLQGGSCIICDITGCKRCDTSISGCDECYERRFFKEGSCSSLCTVGNCTNCKSNIDRCDTCQEGFRLNTDKTACEPCGILYCKSCDVDTRICTDCKKNYFLDGEACTLCPFGCANCVNSTSCQLCDQQYGYYMKNDLTCAKFSPFPFLNLWALFFGYLGVQIFG